MISETFETTPCREASAGADPYLVEHGAPALILALECHRPMALGRRLMLDRLDEVVIGRGTSDRIGHTGRLATLSVGDSQTSRQHVAIRRTASGWQVTDLGSKNGTVVNGDHISCATLSDGDLIEAGGTLLVFLYGTPTVYEARDRELAPGTGWDALLQTLSVEHEWRINQLTKIAPSQVPVLLRGDTGTGKEVMAHAIHAASGRRGPFVPVNCGALPRDLIESELFGHRRGAFSGATEEREGLVRRAHQGTLFLDEIAELPPDSQVALLRVLQEGEVRPVGASDAVTVDVRVVTATHQDLSRRIAAGRFRQDLYSRIAGFEVTLLPLRERREDLGLLIATILPKVCADPREVSLSKAAARALFQYAWPRNIRELEQTLRTAVGLSEGREIRVEHLPEAIRDYKPPGDPSLSPQDRALREELIERLREAGGNVSAVARAMDRAPIQIRRWCHRLRIDLARYRH